MARIPEKGNYVYVDKTDLLWYGKGYSLPYDTKGCTVVKVGVQFGRETMTVEEYRVG